MLNNNLNANGEMKLSLDTLTSDFRLFDLFGNTETLSVTQLWVLEVENKEAKTSELQFLYARTLPATYQSDSWTGSTSKKAELDEKQAIKIHALMLHTSSAKLLTFLQTFCHGGTLQEASEIATLALDKLDKKSRPKIGSVTFGTQPQIRPVMHLPTRDYFALKTKRLSPSSFASADSAAIFSENKTTLFTTHKGDERKIAKAVCEVLNADTGIKFDDLDAWRLGDFEFICLPGLANAIRPKFELSLKEDCSFILFEPLTRQPSDLLLVLNTYSDDAVYGSYSVCLEKTTEYPLKHIFQIAQLKKQQATAYTLEIYVSDPTSKEWYLQLQIGGVFVRNITCTQNIITPVNCKDQINWLEKQVPHRDKAKLDAAKQIARNTTQSRSEIARNANDVWIDENRSIQHKVAELLPKKSHGHFFPTLSTSGGTSRLDLVSWLRNIFTNHDTAQIAWIDPFMEDVGVDLLHRLGSATGNYLFITTKKLSNDDASGKTERIKNLLTRCKAWGDGYGNVRLRVLVVPESQLHDRMILIRANDGKALAGYHLSNSIQRANDNYPLLVTPIPLDVLPDVFEFVDGVIQNTYYGEGKKAPTSALIFDSETNKSASQATTFHPPAWWNLPSVGDVLAWWLEDADLVTLSGENLREDMQTKKYLTNESFNREWFGDIPKKLWSEGLSLPDFDSAWDTLGVLLAHNPYIYESLTSDLSPLSKQFRENLLAYLHPSRTNALSAPPRKSYLDIEYYLAKSLKELLSSHHDPLRDFQGLTRESTWGDCYATKILWLKAPNELISWLQTICAEVINPQSRKYALVNDALQIISLMLSFKPTQEQLEALLKSNLTILVWIGIHTLKKRLIEGQCDHETLMLLELLEPNDTQRMVLCWMINEAHCAKSNSKTCLTTKLIELIQAPVTDQTLQNLLEPMRGRSGRLYHITPWILESVLTPMLERKLITPAQLSRVWLNDLLERWELILNKKEQSVCFLLESDGGFTDEVAILISSISVEYQHQHIEKLWQIFNKCARIIRRPLSADFGYSHCIHTQEINLWLNALLKRVISLTKSDCEHSLEELLAESDALADLLPTSDMRQTIGRFDSYLIADPDEIKAHRLLEKIRSAGNVQ